MDKNFEEGRIIMLDYMNVRKCNGWWECAVGIGKFFVTICAAGALFNGISKCFGASGNIFPSFKVDGNGKSASFPCWM